MPAYVAPTARVHPDCLIGEGTHIGEYCVIESDVRVGANCLLEPYVHIKRWTTLGDNNQISAGTALGTDPLDRTFTGERSYLVIGSRNKIREHFTISRGTKAESTTRLGDDNFVMTAGHIAHNCEIGNFVTVASNTLIAGYATVEDRAFLSGGVVVHQFCRVGSLSMSAGNGRAASDLPPYFLYAGFDLTARGLNLVGLKRAGFTREEISRLKAAYRLLYRSGLPLHDALARIDTELPSAHTRCLVNFIRGSRRGIAREPRRLRSEEEEDRAEVG